MRLKVGSWICSFGLKSNVGTEVGSGSCGSKIVMLVCRL